jgi:hypothetical protein
MATERQTAANRRNASASTGPRSGSGRKRASRNSYRHGLAARAAPSAKLAKAVERLARKIARDSSNTVVLEHACATAQALFDLARIRQIKVTVIERTLALGASDTLTAESPASELVEAEAGPSPTALERLAEAMRQALPELVKLDRYERRACARRDRAILDLSTSERAARQPDLANPRPFPKGEYSKRNL